MALRHLLRLHIHGAIRRFRTGRSGAARDQAAVPQTVHCGQREEPAHKRTVGDQWLDLVSPQNWRTSGHRSSDDDDEAVSAEKACDVVDRGDLKDPADARIPPGSTTQPFEEVISLPPTIVDGRYKQS